MFKLHLCQHQGRKLYDMQVHHHGNFDDVTGVL